MVTVDGAPAGSRSGGSLPSSTTIVRMPSIGTGTAPNAGVTTVTSAVVNGPVSGSGWSAPASTKRSSRRCTVAVGGCSPVVGERQHVCASGGQTEQPQG